jgi:ribosomal-protein-alanine N-acetyltransferase
VTSIKLQYLNTTLLPAVVELDRLCFGGLWTLEGYQRELDSPNSDLLVIVPEQSSSPLIGLGCYWAILDEAHITILGIHPQYQRHGLGQLMLCALLDRARQRDMARATLEVRASNQSAIFLYQKLGFQVAGRRKRYYTDTGEDALILWRGGLQSNEFATLLATRSAEIHHRLTEQHWALHLSPDLATLEKSTLTYL